jgi:hypothetical protein
MRDPDLLLGRRRLSLKRDDNNNANDLEYAHCCFPALTFETAHARRAHLRDHHATNTVF